MDFVSSLEFPDGDNDGLSDEEEMLLGFLFDDVDVDDDGIIDGMEFNFVFDDDGDGVIIVLDVDLDDDGVLDGMEFGVMMFDVDIDLLVNYFVVDVDLVNMIWMLVVDMDYGGILDGGEDENVDGCVDFGEIDFVDFDDDGFFIFILDDVDGDGISDKNEGFIGMDLNNFDIDGDSILDGVEVGDLSNFFDMDVDGIIDVLDLDSDDDIIFDV